MVVEKVATSEILLADLFELLWFEVAQHLSLSVFLQSLG